jgi:hypothetical protein
LVTAIHFTEENEQVLCDRPTSSLAVVQAHSERFATRGLRESGVRLQQVPFMKQNEQMAWGLEVVQPTPERFSSKAPVDSIVMAFYE